MNTWHNRKKRSTLILPATLIFLLLGLIIIIIIPSIKPLFGPSVKIGEKSNLPAVAPAETEVLSAKDLLPIELNVPEGAGHIVEGFRAASEGEDNKVIIHIQDIHTNYEAQKNLCRIIEALIKEKGLELIMVEGGWGDVSLSYLRSYADKERRLEVAEEYLKEGKISGEEYLDIVSDYPISLEGLEEEQMYRENLDAFFEIEKFRTKGASQLMDLKAAVERLKEKIYPPRLKELEKTKKRYEDEQISLADYYKHINTLAKKNREDLSAFPNFKNFIGVTESEKDINFPTVEKERSQLIEKLSKKLPKNRLAALVTKSLEFRLNKLTPSEYHTYLIKEAEEAGEELGGYPNLKKYVAYISSHEEINTNTLFEEAEELLVMVKERLITDSRQKRLDEISNSIRVLDNFLNLKLVPNDFKYYMQHKSDFITANWTDFLNKELQRARIKHSRLRPARAIDENLSTLVRFYDIANQRDDIFVKNAIRLMNEKEQEIAVLIAGGFHTPALTQKLKECGLSYIVVAPHTTQQTDPDLYRYILKYKSGREE